jgi:hypothetical protein
MGTPLVPGFEHRNVAGQKLTTCHTLGVIQEISETEALRLSKPVSRYGLPRYSHPVGCYRTAWGTWYGMFKHRGRGVYTGTRATAAEAYADVLAARAGLAKG